MGKSVWGHSPWNSRQADPAPSSIQEMMALRVLLHNASIPTAPPCIAGHHERTCWLLLLLIPFRTACCWSDC